MSMAAVVLAAGAASRAQVCKALLRGPHGTLVGTAVRAAWDAGASQVFVTVGAHAAVGPAATAADPRTVVVPVPAWADGQQASLAAAIAALATLPGDVEAAWLLVADQPLLTPAVLVSLEDAWRRTGADAAAAHYAGVTGVPALVARPWWARLAGGEASSGRAAPDGGARALLRDPSRRIARVEWPDGAFDVDTPADVARLAALVADATAR